MGGCMAGGMNGGGWVLGKMAIAAGGTHPTGMHSCNYTCIQFNLLQFTSCVLVQRRIELCLSNVLA